MNDSKHIRANLSLCSQIDQSLDFFFRCIERKHPRKSEDWQCEEENMAAVICRTILKPFEWCAKGCNACCNALGECCEECSKCCGETFGPCCAELAKCCNLQEFFAKPFSTLVAAALFLTLLPSFVLFGFVGANARPECAVAESAGINLDVWCIVQGVTFILHFMMAYYVFKKFQVPQYPGESFYKRLCHLVCEDVVMAFYICFLIFALVWAILGSGIDMEADAAAKGCRENELNVMADVILTLTWVFFGVGFFAFIYAAVEGSINDGCCTRECGGEKSPCVMAGRCCCGDTCCPTQAEMNARQAMQAQRDMENGVAARNPVQQDMNRQPNVAYAPPSRPAPVPVVYAQPVQATPVAYQTAPAQPHQQQRQQQQQGEPKTAGDQAVGAAVAVGGAAARLAGKGFKMGAKALFGSGKSKKNTGKK
jgi:hypothetical protein